MVSSRSAENTTSGDSMNGMKAASMQKILIMTHLSVGAGKIYN